MNKLNYTEKLMKKQDSSSSNALKNLLEKLPLNLDETAKEHGAIVRRRGIKCAADLFIALAIYVVMKLSQRVLAAAYAGTVGISDQAWQKKFEVRTMVGAPAA